MATTYTAQLFFDGDVLHGPSEITVTDGRVSSVNPFHGTPEHYLLCPGFIDVQVNGFGAVNVAAATSEEFVELDKELLRFGTTSWFATIVTAPRERMSASLESLHNLIATGATGCVGIHLEGPFLGTAPGAHNPQWIVPFDREWCSSWPSSVRLITVAPEQQDVITNIGELVERGIVVSLGHTRATKQQFNDAVAAGATMVTHLFNGMSGVHHRDGGVAMFALTNNEVVAGLIGDLVHVSHDAVALAFSAKGGSGICLVSDSVAWRSEWAQKRGLQIVGGAPRLADGTLAGSSTPLATCVQHAVKECGVSLIDALASATRTPSDLLGYPQIGRIAVGQRADLVLMNQELSVVEVRRGLVSICG